MRMITEIGVMEMDKIALYMRLSKEDDRIQDESNSITNQRAM